MTIAQVRRRLDETIARFWTDQELSEWLVEAAQDVARRTETLQTFGATFANAGQSEYLLMPDVLRIHVVLFSRDPNLAWALGHHPDPFPPIGMLHDPTAYQLWGYAPNQLTLRIWPPPSIRGTIYVAYYRTPTVLDVPTGWVDLLTDYCEYHALRKDHDPRWQEARNLYEDKINRMIDTTRRWTDQAGQIIGIEGGAFPFIPPVVPTGEGWDISKWDQGVWT